MSKRTKRCPDCGAQIPQGAATCHKCGCDVSADGYDGLDSLPRPIRPEAPRPVDTSRWPERSDYEERKNPEREPGKPNWQLITVLAVIAVIVILAIVLVVKLTAPADSNPANESENFTPNAGVVHEIDANGNIISATEPPQGEEEPQQPETTPETTPEAAPETEEPEATPEPTDKPEAEEEESEPEEEEEPAFVVSEMNDTIYITGTGVNLREGPGTDYDVVTSKSRGTELKRTGATDNGWSRVEYDGKECYVSNSYISTDKPEAVVSEASGTMVVSADANLREGAGTDYDVVTTVEKGTELERTGKADNGWTRVKYDGKVCYVHDSLIEEKTEETAETTDDTGDEENQETEENGKTVVVVPEAGANLREGAGTDYDVVASVPKGTELTAVGEETDGWIEISYNDKTAYVAANLVTEK